MFLKQLFSLEGKTALVTGASRGLGARICHALDQAGARVVLAARDRTRLVEVAAGLQNDPVEIALDLTDPEELHELGSRVLAAAGDVDILINNAGIARLRPLAELTLDDWDMTQALNLRAPFELAKHFSQHMIARGHGKIINVASVMAHVGDLNSSAYTASKAGMVGLTRSLAVELGPHGIQVNALCPGYFLTDMVDQLKEDDRFQRRLMRRVPARRWGEPADMDGAVIFLASSGSDFVNGQALAVDGGLLAGW